MAERLPDIGLIAARVTDWGFMDDHDHWAMATMISPSRAVAVARSVPEAATELMLAFYPGPETVKARVLIRDTKRDLLLIETEPMYDRPHYPLAERSNPFAEYETYAVVPPANQRFISGGTYNLDTVTFPSPTELLPSAVGAPLVSEGMLHGILNSYVGDGTWTVVPASQIHESSFKQIEAAAPSLLFSRLTPGALRALSYAAGAAGTGPVTTDHLFYGLNENYAGTTRRLFRARGVTAPRFEADPLKLSELPNVDAEVQLALDRAVHIAGKLGAQQIRGRHLLHGALSVKEFGGLTPDDVQLGDDRPVLGHRADTVEGEDLLDIKREARVLAGVLGASTVEPPISLGLFGEWGSGKSFFMREMERQFAEIERKPGYCRSIVQIWFNAWHYIDTPNLWASLAAEIFERLDFELTVRQDKRPRDRDAYERAGALAHSAKVRDELATLAAARTQIESKLEEVGRGLAELQDERVIASGLGLRSVFTAAAGAAATDPQAEKEIAQIRDRIAEAQKKLRPLGGTVAELRETTERGRAIALAVKKMPLMSWLLVILFLLLIVGGAIVATQVNDALAATIGTIGVLLAPIVAALTPGGKAARALYKAWTLKEDLIAKERAAREAPLLEDQDRLTKELAGKKKEEEKKADELQASEKKLADLEPKRQMSNFVSERKKSTVYTSHLGVIASAHDDFAELSRLLKRTTKDENLPDVDRIVLYIDDLDRCPEDKVVDVLQAVHLLLAFPLFIVVVGVDSRWLLHSLQRHLKPFGGAEKDDLGDELWKTTPLNYLEKIFQIPFTMRPMRVDAFGDLIDNLTRPQDEIAREMSEAMVAQHEPQSQPQAQPSPQPEPGQSTPPAAQQTQAVETPAGTPQSSREQKPSEPLVDYLTLTKPETDDMKLMYPLIPSPRAAKRFVNTYRLLRGMIDEYERKAFIGDGAAVQGDYRAALLMLAMLTGHPEEGSEILRELVTADATTLGPDWWAFAEGRITSAKLREDLAEVKAALPTVPVNSVFRKWAPDVSRFSFRSGRIVAAQV